VAEPKTKETSESVDAFFARIQDPVRREDCRTVAKMMTDITGEKPKMWGSSIVGFGRYRYGYSDGSEREWMVTGFSPRKNNLTLYLTGGCEPQQDLLANLGKHKSANACLHLKKLSDVDLTVLRKVIARSVKSVDSKRIK
jgi:hypothetical protein